MSNLNQKGPMGEGPMTGRRMGRCTNFGAARKNRNNQGIDSLNNTDAMNAHPEEYGRGPGCGMGRRMRNRMEGNYAGDGVNQNRVSHSMANGRGGRGRGMGRRFGDNIQE